MEGIAGGPSPSPNSGGARKVIRRASSLQSVVRRQSVAPERPDVDLNQLVRVYMLDGSSKVLQTKASSTVKDVIVLLQFNLDLASIKCHCLFRICNKKVQRLSLTGKIKDAMVLKDGETGDVKILMRAWIHDEEGLFDREAMQDGIYPKVANSALYLKYMEAVCMVMMGKCFLTEDEAVMLGCLKMQADSGDYISKVHTVERMQTRVASSFPSPARERMSALTAPSSFAPGEAEHMAMRVQLLYSRLAGYSKAEAQIEFLRTLRIWCPFYSAAFFTVECQYDSAPNDSTSQPPVIKMSVGVSKQAIFLITLTTPPVILRQPYNRIVKWTTHKEMNIFCYWILKNEFSPQRVEELERARRGGGGGASEDSCGVDSCGVDSKESTAPPSAMNPGDYCDCVYLVSEYSADIELVFSSYLTLLRDRVPPVLPGDEPDEHDDSIITAPSASPMHPSAKQKPPPPPPPPASKAASSSVKSKGKGTASSKRSSLFSKMFMSSAASDPDDHEEEEEDEYHIGGILDIDFEEELARDPHGAGAQQGVAFQQELFPPLSVGNIDILNGGSGEAQIAATMEELNNLCFKDFLDEDDEDDEDDNEDEDSDNSSKSAEKSDLRKPPPARRSSLFKW